MTRRCFPSIVAVCRGARLGLAVLILAAAAQAQATIIVDQVANTFVPADVSVQAGDTVRWVWSNGVHDVLEGTDELIDPTDAFYGLLTASHPTFEWTFDTKFLFEAPRVGHVYDYVCSPHFFSGMVGTVTVQSPWTNLLASLPGGAGAPLFWGTGPLTSGSANTLTLEGAAPSSASMLFVGLVEGSAPFKGGTLVPIPYVLQIPLTTSPGGGLSLPVLWPAGLTGVAVVMQVAVLDPGAVAGVALSNALRAVGN